MIGTPDMAIDQIDRLMKQSNGGFGSYLLMHHEWARPDAVHRSYELIAQHVAPKFQGSANRLQLAEQTAIGEWEELGDRVERAVQDATDRHFGQPAAN
ncbi:MAG: hypothetical protein R2710_08970 [Acidimicrobiales bacterium]